MNSKYNCNKRNVLKNKLTLLITMLIFGSMPILFVVATLKKYDYDAFGVSGTIITILLLILLSSMFFLWGLPVLVEYKRRPLFKFSTIILDDRNITFLKSDCCKLVICNNKINYILVVKNNKFNCLTIKTQKRFLHISDNELIDFDSFKIDLKKFAEFNNIEFKNKLTEEEQKELYKL
ncbi:hypothetical protein AAEX28_15160 [Lentisphaerota bacterium WC36G]|nr:hypothetical protein LJT99_01915 [Lentisphaerae bacterium WC36]